MLGGVDGCCCVEVVGGEDGERARGNVEPHAFCVDFDGRVGHRDGVEDVACFVEFEEPVDDGVDADGAVEGSAGVRVFGVFWCLVSGWWWLLLLWWWWWWFVCRRGIAVTKFSCPGALLGEVVVQRIACCTQFNKRNFSMVVVLCGKFQL